MKSLIDVLRPAAEIERLRLAAENDLQRLLWHDKLLLEKEAEIERLHELLRECIEWVEFKEDGGLRYAHGAPELVKRVHEALGEQ